MRVSYKLTVTALCPVTGERDYYCAVVQSERTIMVEELLVFFEQFSNRKMTQEELSELTVAKYPTARISGYHKGVFVECQSGETI